MPTMNIKQLRAILNYLKVPNEFYNLGEYGLRDMRVCLEKKLTHWEVFFSERGQHFDVSIFDNETDACLALLKEALHMEW
ncbi:MAG: hypothetical protein Q4C72_09630 [Eubacteriales bacterium]|nr:hypothetical protein [Eubacteriales bacterium]